MRVFGPYPSGNRWRLLVREGGHQKALPFETREQAEKIKVKMLANLEDFSGKTVGEAVAEFLAGKKDSGCKLRSILFYTERLKFLPPSEPLLEITAERAEKLYRAQTEKLSAATHHKELRTAKALFAYCVRQRYITVNPFQDIRPIGRAKVGKLQLRRDEARKLSTVLLHHAAKGDRSALALAVQLLLGLRSAEVLNLRKRDLDADGTILVVDGTKTKNARRLLLIESPIVRELLARRVLDLRPESLIFAEDHRQTPLHTDHLFKKLHKFCKLAEVPEVCPHSLRGLHSSLAVEGGATSGVVAAALGHGNDAVTLKHYIAPGAMDSARSARVSAALFEPDLDKLIANLRALSAAQLDRVLLALGVRH